MKKSAFISAAALLLGGETAGAEPGPVRFPNPLSQADAPDPCVVRAGDELFMICTGGTRERGVFPIRRSGVDDRKSWTVVGSVFPPGVFPPWARGENGFWAPEVHRVGDRYVCYFNMRDAAGRFCIGTATAPAPTGPYTPQPEPLASNPQVGLIDATCFLDPVTGRRWAMWKEDRNDFNPPQPTGMAIQELEADGLKLKGEPAFVLYNDQPWEGVLVEGPSLLFRKGWYYLFYSGNVYSDDGYAVGVARSRAVTGPYEKYAANPILRADGRFSGPGHQFLVEEQPGDWTVYYHARDRKRIWRPSTRMPMSDAVQWRDDGWPRVNDGAPSAGWNGWPKPEARKAE